MINIYEINFDNFDICDYIYYIIYFSFAIYVFFINKLKMEINNLETNFGNINNKIDNLYLLQQIYQKKKHQEKEYQEKETQYELDINLNNNIRLLYVDSDNNSRKTFEKYINNIMKCEYILLGDTYEDCENILDAIFNYQPDIIVLCQYLKYKEKDYLGTELYEIIKKDYNNCKFIINSNNFENNYPNLLKDADFDGFLPCKLSL